MTTYNNLTIEDVKMAYHKGFYGAMKQGSSFTSEQMNLAGLIAVAEAISPNLEAIANAVDEAIRKGNISTYDDVLEIVTKAATSLPTPKLP